MHKETTTVTQINWDWGKATKYPIKTIAFLGFLYTIYFLMTQHCISLVHCIRRTFFSTGRSNFGALFYLYSSWPPFAYWPKGSKDETVRKQSYTCVMMQELPNRTNSYLS
jgi:hypothetical protein